MERKERKENRRCPKCGKEERQMNMGYNRSGTRRRKCGGCGRSYTLEAKTIAYSEEAKQAALRIYYSGVSARGVGKALKMSKANVFNWIKKTGAGVDKSGD